MPRLILSFLALCLLPAIAQARCAGTDLRPTLTDADRTALDTRLASMPYTTGNHWRATRGAEVIHLIGTLHVSDPRMDALVDRLHPVLGGAAVLLLEMTEAERDALMQAIGSRPDMLLLEGATLPERMEDAQWQALSDALRRRGMPPFMAARFQPWYVSMILSLPACLEQALTDMQGLDARLEAAAKEAGIPVAALEPYDTGFAALRSVPMDMQIDMVLSALLPSDAGEDLLETLIAAYFEEAHAESWITSEFLAARLAPLPRARSEAILDTMTEVLLVDRNRAWIPVILDALKRSDGPVVAAFGAAHLSGREGVPALLEAAGFTLERLPF